jgi:hypothetical protein
MQAYALGASSASRPDTSSTIVAPIKEQKETARRLRALYPEITKTHAENTATYGCVDWYLYPKAQEAGQRSIRS